LPAHRKPAYAIATVHKTNRSFIPITSGYLRDLATKAGKLHAMNQ
jgi:hypothetical protein